MRRVLAVAAAFLLAALGVGFLPGPAAAEFVRDHCVCEKMPNGGGIPECELSQCCKDRGRGHGILPCLLKAGYKPACGHTCRVGGVDFVHVIYSAPGKDDVSVYIGARLGGLDGRLLPFEREDHVEGYEVDHLRCPGGVHYVVVADAGIADAVCELVRQQIGR
jgi:hypothetical protein